MNFVIFLWNWFARTVGFVIFLMIEIGVFWFILQVLKEANMPVLATILKIVFSIWLVVEIIMRLLVGGFKNLISYLLRI